MESKKLSTTKIIALGIAAVAVVAGAYFKVDIAKALDSFTKTEAAVEKAISE